MARLRTAAGFALAVVPFLALCSTAFDYVPLWDARIYADCILHAAHHGTFPTNYSCADHPTHAYALLLSLPLQFGSTSYVGMIVVDLLLGLVALWAFWDLARLAFPETAQDSALLVACLGMMPVLVAGTLNVNPDYGVMVCLLLLLRALLRESLLGVQLAGLALVFCKETGLLLLGLAVGLHALLFALRTPEQRARWREWLPRYAAAFTGLPLLVLWFLHKPKDPAAQGSLWLGNSLGGLLKLVFRVDLFDPVFVAQLMSMFLLQFAWIPTLFALTRWLPRLWTLRRRWPLPSSAALYLQLCFAGVVFVFTRYPTFINPRYFLPAWPLLLLCAWAALSTFRPLVRRGALLVMAVAFLAGNFRSIDPVSRAIWGTFPFGDHELYELTSFTGECCGRSRDQLVYNLEHVELHRLQDRLYAVAPPSRLMPLVANEMADWYFVGFLSPTQKQRTLDPSALLFHTVPPLQLMRLPQSHRPARILYVKFPNLRDQDSELQALTRFYQPRETVRVEHDGYALEALVMEKR
ncbi:MAG: hypothetical protein JST92_20520 [Deltaproteobacteria bacterium]|nr:hypothetical protein [Deltaproteobacteria bacterium]